MVRRLVFLLFASVGVLPVLALQPRAEATAPTDAFPRFSWSTLPVFWHAWGLEPFNASTLDFINRFPLVTIEKGMSADQAPMHRQAEVKMVAAAEQVKRRNSTIKVLFYLNSFIDWSQYELHQYCLAHEKTMWLFNTSNEPTTLHDQHIFDMSSETVRNVWIDVLTKVNQSGFIDGVFIDKGGDPIEVQPTFRDVDKEKFHQLVLGHRQLMSEVHATFGDHWLSVTNHADYSALSGRMFERFMLSESKHPNHTQAYADVVTLQHESTYPHIAEVHIEPCNPTTFNTTLAGYLVGAGKYAYYGCTDGFSLSTGWLHWFDEYSRPLGEPASEAVTIATATGFCKPESGSDEAANDSQYVGNDFWSALQERIAKLRYGRHHLHAWIESYWKGNPLAAVPILGRRFSSGTCVTLDFNVYPPRSCIAWADGTHTGSSVSCLAST